MRASLVPIMVANYHILLAAARNPDGGDADGANRNESNKGFRGVTQAGIGWGMPRRPSSRPTKNQSRRRGGVTEKNGSGDQKAS
jgi:hypothetical protein